MRKLIALAACSVLSAGGLSAQEVESPEDFGSGLTYKHGDVSVGSGLATLAMPDSYRFLPPDEALRLLVDGWGNPPMDAPLGAIVPSDLNPMNDDGWAVILTFEEDGYVEDDDAASIDYEGLLEQMKADTRADSEAMVEVGYDAVELVGWAALPHYDAEAKKLYWAKELSFGESEEHTLNYNVRILGRRGVLVLNAVAGMEQLPSVESDMKSVMAFVDFNDGHAYSDFTPGVDKVAAYGIGALVAGKVAAKVGFFKLLLAGPRCREEVRRGCGCCIGSNAQEGLRPRQNRTHLVA